ncbi:helix-turn-helix domain-containing protein [Nocardia sp. 348MFTsu5.1]|uniref:helix-turn-helix domain-containing protein n=1 Tax=Nocardia sp. 348MFTsu5.1 TaxID=1172185 RepID=UPI00035F612A|nr:helix-turn-helix transcriptional regulator [Nocardia sp. 348MFTsu5.1]
MGPHLTRVADADDPASAELLWREALGAFLRRVRTDQQRILTDIAAQAGVSPQYLSEIERGRKEPSSEILAAVSGALGLSLLQITRGVADALEAMARPRPAVTAIGGIQRTTATTHRQSGHVSLRMVS